MSARQVRKTVRALLADAGLGLKPKVVALAAAEGLTNIVSDFNFVRGALSGKLLPTGQPSVSTDARLWNPDQKLRSPQRDSLVTLTIDVEFTSADQQQLEDQRDLTAIALAQVLDGLRSYSDANGGTVLDVRDPMSFDIGQFGGPVTTEGFRFSATILERSLQ